LKKLILMTFLLIHMFFQVYPDESVVTVLDFQTNNISVNDMKIIVSLLSASLFDTGKYTVIDRSQRDTILNELKFSLSGCSDESCQLEAGKMLSAELIVVGDLAMVGTRYILNGRILVTETGATAKTARGIYENLDELVDDIPDFAHRLSGKIEELSEESLRNENSDENDKLEEIISDTFDNSPGAPEKEVWWKKFPPEGDLLSWSTFGAGIVLSSIGAYFLIDGLNFKSETMDPSYDLYKNIDIVDFGGLTSSEYYDQLWNYYSENLDEFQKKMIIGGTVTLVGAVAISLSTLFFKKYNFEHNSNTAFFILPGSPGLTHAGFSIRVRY